jgi:hypothetical protein
MDTISRTTINLPNDLKAMNNEFSIYHRKEFYWALQDIINTEWCQSCDKVIKKNVYSRRGGDDICCSEECVDNLCLIRINKDGKWVYNGEEYVYSPTRKDYEFKNY